MRAPQTHLRAGFFFPASRWAGSLRGESRLSQVSGPSLSYAPRAIHHARCASSSPITAEAPWPSGPARPWAPGTADIFGAVSPRLARSRAYASPAPSLGTVARLASEWSGSTFSGGSFTRRTTNRISKATACFLLSDQPCLVATAGRHKKSSQTVGAGASGQRESPRTFFISQYRQGATGAVPVA